MAFAGSHAYLSVGDEAFHDIACQVRRYCKADAAGSGENGSFNAGRPLNIHERATRVTWINRGIGLNDVFVLNDTHATAALGVHDAHRNGLTNAERISRLTPRNADSTSLRKSLSLSAKNLHPNNWLPVPRK